MTNEELIAHLQQVQAKIQQQKEAEQEIAAWLCELREAIDHTGC